MNVIFHIDETNRWQTALANIKNFSEWQKQHADKGTIELLINGEAVEQAVTGDAINLEQLVNNGIDVAVCQNAMRQRQITHADLQQGVRIVPAGVVELAMKQTEGFSYIKP
ncbi:MAG: DsrE family protein [Leuconostoc fallax]